MPSAAIWPPRANDIGKNAATFYTTAGVHAPSAQARRLPSFHHLEGFRDQQAGLNHRLNLLRSDARRNFGQHQALLGNVDHTIFGNNMADAPDGS